MNFYEGLDDDSSIVLVGLFLYNGRMSFEFESDVIKDSEKTLFLRSLYHCVVSFVSEVRYLLVFLFLSLATVLEL